MSIIFKTLEKLKNETRQNAAGQTKTGKHNNVISFDKIVSSLPRLLMAGILVIGFGAATYYIIKNLGNNASGSETVNAAYLPPMRNTNNEPDRAEPWNRDSQQNGTEPMGMEVLGPEEKTPPFIAVTADYSPPGLQQNSNPPHQEKVEKQVTQYFQPALTHTAAVLKKDMDPVRNFQKNPEQRIPSPENETVEQTTKKRQQKNMHLATVKKNYRICRLVLETRQSLLSENVSRTESLLNELTAYKGKDDDYVMSLRAFWHLKREEYEAAGSFLDLLLQKDENDLEAGINMAVLEIKTNRLAQAQTRLEKLRRINADNSQILSLLRKIKNHNPKNRF